MSDGVALPALALIAIGLVALALVWPQGQGARSPAPFGHPLAALPGPIIQTLKNQAISPEVLKHPLTVLRGPEAPPRPAPRRAPNSPP
jgi:hypothetical protein